MAVLTHRVPVRAEYDALAHDIEQVWHRPPCGDGEPCEAAGRLLAAEARLLDGRRFAQWLELWADEATFWVPIDAGSHPGRDQSLLLDDRRRLGERVRWMADPAAWGVQPVPVVTRLVAGVEAWMQGDEMLTVSALMLHAERSGATTTLAARQVHRWIPGAGPGGLVIRRKILLIPKLTSGVGTRGFLL